MVRIVEAPFEIPSGLTLETDVSVAAWVDERLLPRRGSSAGVLVGELVPTGFESYARVLHPAQRRVGDGYRSLRWAELAQERGKLIHPEVQLKALLGEEFRDGLPWGELPGEGSIPDELRRPLVGTLRGFTRSPDRCFFCIWEGYGFWGGGIVFWSTDEPAKVIRARERKERRRAEVARRLLERIPKVDMMRAGPERIPQWRYLLFTGGIDAVVSLKISGIWSQSPNYWWPDDRKWIVVSDVDAPFTYVGGSEQLVEALLAEPQLEVVTSALEHRFDWMADRINAQDGT